MSSISHDARDLQRSNQATARSMSLGRDAEHGVNYSGLGSSLRSAAEVAMGLQEEAKLRATPELAGFELTRGYTSRGENGQRVSIMQGQLNGENVIVSQVGNKPLQIVNAQEAVTSVNAKTGDVNVNLDGVGTLTLSNSNDPLAGATLNGQKLQPTGTKPKLPLEGMDPNAESVTIEGTARGGFRVIREGAKPGVEGLNPSDLAGSRDSSLHDDRFRGGGCWYRPEMGTPVPIERRSSDGPVYRTLAVGEDGSSGPIGGGQPIEIIGRNPIEPGAPRTMAHGFDDGAQAPIGSRDPVQFIGGNPPAPGLSPEVWATLTPEQRTQYARDGVISPTPEQREEFRRSAPPRDPNATRIDV